MNIIQKVKNYAHLYGTKQLFRRAVLQEQPKIDVFTFFKYVIDDTIIEKNEKDFEEYKDKDIILNWIIPEMGVGSGGHINIFRFISYLERNGIHNRVYLFNSFNIREDDQLRKFVKTYFQILDERVELYADAFQAKFAHATIATEWRTAYFVKNFNNTISKFYFVQDFEPYFFAKGSEYEFAYNTYKFGLRGLTAGDWLKDICQNEFNMPADSFGFSYDKELYHPIEKKDDVKRVFFYARPVTPRRDFELGLLALNELAKKVPDLEVVFAGWDISNYKIPFNYVDKKILPLEELSDLYSQCDMCLIISNTNLSLLPLEVMASNSVAVCSKGENSTWLVNDENSILVDYDPMDIANKIAYYFEHPDELATIRKKGLQFAQSTSWDNECEKVRQAILKGIQEDAK